MHASKDVTLLLVDDDEIDAMTVERGLKENKIANPIVRAKNGLEAINLMESGTVQSPYVILLDLQMPRMTGLEFLETIRSKNQFKHSVVFVLTTSKSEQDIFASYSFNIAGYFIKDDVGSDFDKVIDVLDGYWKIVQLPVQKHV